MKLKGKIIKGIAGFYYVNVGGILYECKGRGNFKNNGIKLLVGDVVEIDTTSLTENVATITKLYPRKNELIRPSISNVDQIIIVMSLSYPKPDFTVLDKIVLNNLTKNIYSIIIFNKSDETNQEFINYIKTSYSNSGIPIFFISAINDDLNEIKSLLRNKISVFSGNSGVGKSTIINKILNQNIMEVGKISKKIQRGKHTTRHSEIFTIDENSYIADTPGYGKIDIKDIKSEELKKFYPEFSEFSNCKYNTCTHIHEPNCGVKRAVKDKLISELRYENYKKIFYEIKEKYE